MAGRIDQDKVVAGFAAHADACLIDAQACVSEGHSDRAAELRSVAETWVRLIAAVNGAADDME